MRGSELGDLVAFLAVAEERSFTRAAARLGISQSALSYTVRRLETRLGLRLLNRTTRSVSPTEGGERLLRTLSPAFDQIQTELVAVGELRDKPAGTIRITANDHAADTILWPAIAQLLPKYPDIKVELDIDYGLTDIVADRYDAGVRLGDQVAKDMIAVRIGPDPSMAVVGAPAYFAARPAPKSPQELVNHNCINFRQPSAGGLYAWEFEKRGRELRVRVDGQLVFNGMYQILAAARAGFGLAYLLDDLVQEDVAEGRLTRVLAEWCPPFSGYHLYYPSRRQPAPAFGLLVDALRFKDEVRRRAPRPATRQNMRRVTSAPGDLRARLHPVSLATGARVAVHDGRKENEEETMPTQLEQIRDQQQATWDKFSVGWRKWDQLVLSWLADVGIALLDEAHLRPDSHVLDIASGTGEPALSAAALCPRGRVMMTDLAEKMLIVARESAARRGLRNVETLQCDASALPFADNTYDAVTARFGFMFFPDVPGAARELARVAKPGARVCTAVWGPPEKNQWATLIMATIAQHVEMPAPPPGAPGLFRCAAAGYMAGVFREAGLENVTEREIAAPIEFDSPEEYFAFMNEVAAPVVAGMSKADEATRAKIKEAVIALATGISSGGKTRLHGSAIVVCGDK